MELGPWLERKAWEDTRSPDESPGSSSPSPKRRRPSARPAEPVKLRPWKEVYPPLGRPKVKFIMPWPFWLLAAFLFLAHVKGG